MSSSQVLSQEFESLKNDLISAYDSKGMRASGKFAEELEVWTSDNHAILWGEKYAEQLEDGRNSGKQPPSDMIEQWIYDKGIAAKIDGEISVSSLAFLIARKIGREGWKREEHGGVNLISEIITENRLQKILNEVGEAKLIEFSSHLQSLVQELEAA